MNTSDKPFKTSVIVDTGLGADRDVKSVREALDTLSHAWPADRRGSAYDEAVQACARALDSQLSVERARDAFSTAAWEAEIFVSDLGRMDTKPPDRRSMRPDGAARRRALSRLHSRH